ncbi:uncharacterized protein [Periplaneta americana]|uniref:uncharacterized protein isoform X8 n=1 Tax=Periplaneta americana TaxID=6978 RepID=UPI0037E77DE5
MSETMDVPLVKLDMMKTESFEDDHVDTSQYFSLVNVKEEKIQMDISFPTVKSESEEEAIWNDTVLKGEVKEEHQILQERHRMVIRWQMDLSIHASLCRPVPLHPLMLSFLRMAAPYYRHIS